MSDDSLRDIAKVTGYWTDGIFKGTLIAAPPLMVLSLTVGAVLWLVRRGTAIGGLD